MAGFISASKPSFVTTDDACYVVLSEHGVLCGEMPWRPLDTGTWRFAGLTPLQQQFIGYCDGVPSYAVEIAADSRLPPGYVWENLRTLLAAASIDETGFCAVSCAMQVFSWDRDHQYCGRCSCATVPHPEERARVCEACGINYYPRLSPCVIVLITRGEECLLALHRQSRVRFHTALAGFVEPGESVEGALHREVAEEVGVKISDLRYQGSQPWPFPGQLMLGFHAQYLSGDIQVDGVEIEEARWFHYRDLPRVPPASTLSGQLIRGFIAQFGEANVGDKN